MKDSQLNKYLLSPLQRLGAGTLAYLATWGRATILVLDACIILPRSARGVNLFLREIYKLGVLSLPIIVVSAAFVGMVLALQGYTILRNFSAESAVGQLVALSLFRELGPVLAGLLFAGRSGSALTAEISLMKTTEQISSLEMMGVDPVRYLVAPRLWAGLLTLPVLTIVFNMTGIWMGGVVAIEWLGIYEGSYWGNMQQVVSLQSDIINGIIKSLVFAFVVTWIAIFQGYNSTPTAEGIGISTTKTVVYSSLGILGLDFLLTALLFSNI
ncbi:MAG: lipid asymmetry maintenance ABC transporter permease subunit MlaE [Candidatus Portiera sp.]|nr:lipid asymmetry maintenance ABC transporter permease subunit MlaE [Portiera sp.]